MLKINTFQRKNMFFMVFVVVFFDISNPKRTDLLMKNVKRIVLLVSLIMIVSKVLF